MRLDRIAEAGRLIFGDERGDPPCASPAPSLLTTVTDVLVAIELFQAAAQAPCPRNPEGARKWHERIDARKTDLIDAICALCRLLNGRASHP